MLRDHWLRWFEQRMQWGRMSRRGRRSDKRLTAKAALVTEQLEQRTLLTVFTVDSLIDENDGDTSPGSFSLREAVEMANANPGADDIRFSAGFGGRTIDLALGTLTVTDDVSIVGFNTPLMLTTSGLILQADGLTDSVGFSMTGIRINRTTDGPGLLIRSTNDGSITADISNSFFNNSATEGIKIETHSGGEAGLTLSNSSVISNGDVVASAGISVDVGVGAQAESPNEPGKFATATLALSDVDVLNNALEGLKVAVESGGRFETTAPINGSFSGNSKGGVVNEVDLRAAGMGSSIDARLNGVTADNAKASGFYFEAAAGANLNVVLNDSSAVGAGADALRVRTDGAGASAVVSVNNLVANNATDRGIALQSDGPTASLSFTMAESGINKTTNGPGLLLQSTNDGSVAATLTGSFVNNGATEGIKIETHTGGEARLALVESSVISNGDVVPSAGIGVAVGVAAPSESPNEPGKFAAAKLAIRDVEVLNNALEGLKVAVESGGRFQTTIPVTNTTFAGNGRRALRNEVDLRATGAGSSMEARFDGVTADNAKASAFHVEGTAGANLAVVLNNSSATGAGSDAFSFLADGVGTTGAVSVNNFIGDDAARFGADIDVANSAVVRVNNFSNLSLQNAGRSGLDVDLIGGSINAFNAANLNASRSAINGVDLFLREGFSTFQFDGLAASNNVERGIQISSILGANSSVTLNNVSVQGNQTKQPLNIFVNGEATLNLDVNGGTITSAGTEANNSVFASVLNGSTGNLSFDGLVVPNSTSSAFVTRYDHAADGHFEITNTIATGSQVVGMALFVRDGSQVTGNFDGLDVSGNGTAVTADGIRIGVNGLNTTADFTFNNVSANNATKSGIALQYANKATGGITRFDNVSAQNAQRDGLRLDVRGIAQLTSLTGNGVNLSGAGQSGVPSYDALDLQIQGSGTTGMVNFSNLTANAAAGRAVNLSVQNAAVAEVVIDGFSANGSGLQGLNMNVGTVQSGAILQNSVFRNGSFSNNGTVFGPGGSDGVRARVTGVGTLADVTFSGVTANNNLRGFDAQVDHGANFTMALEGASNADGNFFDGVLFRADGPTTTAALTSSMAGSSFDDNGDAGLVALITGGVTVTDLTIIAVASNNGEDGMIIDADDGTGVTINNLSLAGSSFVSNMFTGLILSLDGVLGLGTLNLDGANASGNLGLMTGLNVDVANMTLDAISANNLSLQSNGGAGLDLLLDNVDIVSDVDVTNFNAGGNSGDGVRIALENTTSIAGDLNVDGNASSNFAGGLSILATDGSGVSIGDFQVSGTALMLNNNAGNGVTVDLEAVSGIDSIDFSNMTVNNNAGNQIFVRLKDMDPLTTISFADISAIGPGSGTGDGVNLTLDNTDVTDAIDLSRINASRNGQDGLELNLRNGADIPSSSVDVGTFDENGRHGINLSITNSTAQIDVTNSTFDLLDTIASASNNGGNGLNVRMANANLTMNSIDQIIFDGNAGAGVDIQAATPSDFQSGSSFTNNTVTNNGSFGFRAIFNGGTFDISLGSRTTPGLGNLFDNNVAAAINLDMLQTSLGRFAVVDNTITNTNDDNNPLTDFQGAGVFVRMLGTANPNQATNALIDPAGGPGLLIRDNVMGGTDAMGVPIGNAGSGINFRVEEKSIIDGLHVLDNEVSNSGIDGLNFRRLDEVTINDFRVIGNAFNDSGDDGVEIVAQNDDASAMDITISGNEMNGNTNDGVALQVNADAKLNVDMQSNSLITNGDDGIDLNEVALDVDDVRAIFGTIADNTISDNVNRGVSAGAFMGVTVGIIVTPLEVFDNSIGAVLDEFGQIVLDGNGSTGVHITGGGDSVWTNNDINRNGRLVTADRTLGHGIDIEDDFFGFYDKNIVLDNNRIRENFQDGIELNNHGQSQDPNFAFFFNTSFFVEMIDNRIQDNVGRGLDILNQLLTDTFITIRSSDPSDPAKGNFFNSNGEEGIYAVNTASATQTQDAFASTLLAMDGSVIVADPQLSLVIDSATVSNNGDAANVAGLVQSAGIVVRVGSAGEGVTFGDSSQDFATSVFGPNSGFVPPADVSAPVVPFFANPGVYLHVTNSTMLGNFGDDAFLHGFTSTANPGVISGTWSDMMFAPMIPADGFDPLARLDVFWGTATAGNGNTFDSVEVNNQFGIGIPSTPKGEPGAYYDTAEGTFKSRPFMAMPPGPFPTTWASRRRNAQRVAERVYPGGSFLSPDPTMSPDGGSFLYPGMGDSTFRAFAGGDTAIAAELAAIGFIFDDNPVGGDFSPIEGTFDIRGTSFGPGIGGRPFGWGTY